MEVTHATLCMESGCKSCVNRLKEFERCTCQGERRLALECGGALPSDNVSHSRSLLIHDNYPGQNEKRVAP
jgi:hypothetical protein